MLVDIVLNPVQKKRVFDAIQKISQIELDLVLIEAALNNETFPVDDSDFSLLCDLHARSEIASVKHCLKLAINASISSKVSGIIQRMLHEPFEADKWQTSFLSFVAKALDIEIQNQPLVQLAIQEGKIYWRIINGESVLYDRTARKNPTDAFDFTTANTITMTWEQFRLFKDSGKRGGSVAITEQIFVNELKSEPPTAASQIWAELKRQRILNNNDRLSYGWRFVSGEVKLPIHAVNYNQISKTLNRISTNINYAEQINAIPNAIIYRPERSPRSWASTGRVTYTDSKSNDNQVKLWDVSIFSDLDTHAETGDGLEHDHIPSTCFLNSFVKKHRELTRESIVEGRKDWTCIALPEELHGAGKSHGKGAKAQAKQITSPFLDEVNDYLDKLEQKWQHTPVIDDEYLEALGAFRNMYRCQISGKHGQVSQLFFKQDASKAHNLDALFYDRLQKFMVRKEGGIKVENVPAILHV